MKKKERKNVLPAANAGPNATPRALPATKAAHAWVLLLIGIVSEINRRFKARAPPNPHKSLPIRTNQMF